MGWNEPGGGQDPWGRGARRPEGSPPDIDELLARLRARFGGRGGGGSGKAGIGGGLLALVIVLLYMATGFYVVDEQERGVVLRFGAHVQTTEPGLHWHIPWPVERVEKVNVTQVRSVTDRADMLTQDENIVELELKVQYRLSSAEDYLFNVRDPDTTLRQLTKSAVRDVVGGSTMDFVIKDGRQIVAEQTKQILQERLDEYGAGLYVTEVNLMDAQPPQPVQGAFADAIKAREDQVRLKNEAEAYANDRLPKARGAAARELAEATAYRDQKIAEAVGEASRFTQLLEEYRKAPKITRERLYLETMQAVLGSASKVMVDVDGSSPLIYLPLDRMIRHESGQDGASAPRQMPWPGSGSAQDGGTGAVQTPDYRSRERGRR